MDLIDIRKLHTNHRIGSYIPAFDEIEKFEIKVEDLLLHNSGVSSSLIKPFPLKPQDLLK
jgi:CubicO group peptidase (beta-lactamase class C family)